MTDSNSVDSNPVYSHANTSQSDLSIRTRLTQVGLSTETAMEQFEGIVMSVLRSASRVKGPLANALGVIIYKVFFLFTFTMIVYHDSSCMSYGPFVASMSLVFGLYDMYMLLSEMERRHIYSIHKIHDLLRRTMNGQGYVYGVPTRMPVLAKHQYARVYRDGRLQLCPASLLVAGDVIRLLEGEKEPCKVERIVGPGVHTNECIVLESPIVGIIEGYLHGLSRNPDTQFFRQKYSFQVLCDFITMLCIIAGHWGILIAKGQLHVRILLVQLIKLDVFGAAIRLWEHSRLDLMIEYLKKSKSSYDEAIDGDEFDEEAPPPSKEISISAIDIFKQAFSSLEYISSYCHTPDLVKSLGRMSVLCFTDREGPVSIPFSVPLEIETFNVNSKLTSVEISQIYSSADETVSVWTPEEDYKLGSLRPLALATAVCCKGSFLEKRDYHRRISAEEYKRFIKCNALQACQCAMGRAAGIAGIMSDGQKMEKMGELWLDGLQDPIICFLYRDLQDPSIIHSFIVGQLLDVLDVCNEYYVEGMGLQLLDDSLRRALTDSEEGSLARDEECLGYAYQALFSDEFDGTLSSKNTNLFVFLGSLVCAFRPKDDMQEFIDDVLNAGIRFAYLGREGERQVKSFGSRLGLETDWNCCILLSESSDCSHSDSHPAYSDPSDIKARLPVGVEQVRRHLKFVDDIPLHVSIFADTGPKSATEMIKIYQENDETVAVVISALHPGYYEAASQADLCISMEPGSSKASVSMWEVAAEWHSLPSAFSLSFDSSPYVLTDLIKEARNSLRIRMSSNGFFIISSLIFTVMGGYGYLPLSFILSIFIHGIGTHDSDVLRLMPVKNGDLLRESIDFGVGWFSLVAFICYYPQHTLLSFTCFCIGHLHPVKSIYEVFSELYHRNKAISCALLALFIAIISQDTRQILATGPLFMSEVAKSNYRRRYWEGQKRSKLEFSTKLGMHSPI